MKSSSSEIRFDTTSSGTSSPASMIALTLSPVGVPARTASRNMSPVESWRIPCRSTSRCACVPLPAPGGPSRMMFIGPCPFLRPPCSRGSARSLSQTALKLRLLYQVAVLVRQQVRLDLADGVDRHVDHDQQAGAAHEQRNAGLRDHIFGDHADHRQIV